MKKILCAFLCFVTIVVCFSTPVFAQSKAEEKISSTEQVQMLSQENIIPNSAELNFKENLPPQIKAFFIALCVSLPLGVVIGFLIYKNLISKNKKR